MSNEKRNYRHLDSLLSGLEDGILSLTDLEVETECSWYSENVRDVRRVIDACLRSHNSGLASLRDHGDDQVIKRPKESWADIPVTLASNSYSDKRKFLAHLLAHQSGVPKELRMAFSGQRAPTDIEVEALVERLVRLGVLRHEDSMDDNT